MKNKNTGRIPDGIEKLKELNTLVATLNKNNMDEKKYGNTRR